MGDFPSRRDEPGGVLHRGTKTPAGKSTSRSLHRCSWGELPYLSQSLLSWLTSSNILKAANPNYESLFKWTIRPDQLTYKQVVARDHLELSRWCASISSSRLPTSCRYSPSVKLEKCQHQQPSVFFVEETAFLVLCPMKSMGFQWILGR